MKVASDIDGVLADFITPFIRDYINPELASIGEPPMSASDVVAFEFERTIDISKKRIFELFDKSEADNIYRNLEVYNNGFRRALQNLDRRGHDIYYITVRGKSAIMDTYRWIINNGFPLGRGVFFSEPGKKGELCSLLGIDVMAEDNIKYAVDIAGHVNKSFLVDRPWNKEDLKHIVVPSNLEVIRYGKQLEDYVLSPEIQVIKK